MRNLSRFNLRAAVFAVSLLTAAPAMFAASAPATLKDTFQNYFSMGVAINQRQIMGEDTNGVALIVSQYNAISPENVMKWEVIHPRPGKDGYDFKAADAYVEFGEKHHMLIVGHTLAWHSQTPAWVFRTDDGRQLQGTNEADRQILLERLHDHIQTVVGRYKGRIAVWDVVNEALNDSSSETDTNVLRRNSPWVRILGQEFIEKAFQWAHEADPACTLRYNDYSIENPAKRRRLITLIKSLQAKNIPVMAIGSQTHANLNWPSAELEDQALTDIASLGLPIHITEMDVNASAGGQRSQSADVADNAQAAGGGTVNAADEKSVEQYASLFRMFLKHKKDIKLITLWGLTDRDSWRGLRAKALLFDGNWQPKPAFDAVIKEAKSVGATTASSKDFRN
jgi:endo-1,4-beta-xylanase